MTDSEDAQATHGGPGALGAAPHDFSTNANACGPCPSALAAVRAADATRYPDPASTALRERLAGFHGVARERIVVAASGSEFIARITAAVAQLRQRRGTVQVPVHAYGDYAHAAHAQGLSVGCGPPGQDGVLGWGCDPSSPLGDTPRDLGARLDALPPGAPFVLDRAYAPLRLAGDAALRPAQLDRAWQLWSPNKALGLTGVRGAYAIAPADGADPALLRALHRLAPSWPLGAHGVAMLQAWTEGEAQAWLAGCLPVLRTWKAGQQALCRRLGWTPLDSDAGFFCVRLPDADPGALLRRLRAAGVQLRDCASFGLPGHARLGVRPPADQAALEAAATASAAR